MQYKDSVYILEEGKVDCKGFSTMCLVGEDYKKLGERLNERFPNAKISDDEHSCYVYPTAVHSRFEHCIG